MRLARIYFAAAAGMLLTACSGSMPPVTRGTAGAPAARSTHDVVSSVAVQSAATGGSAAPALGPYERMVLSDGALALYTLADGGKTMSDSGPSDLNGVYGANVRHEGASLTTTGHSSTVFPGAPAGAANSPNVGAVTANAAFARAAAGLTVEAWVKPALLNISEQYVTLACYGRELQGPAWAVEETATSLVQFWLRTTAGPSFKIIGTAPLLADEEYYVAVTYNGSRADVYVNGALQNSQPVSGTIDYSNISPQYGLAVGGGLGSNWPQFDGSMADVAVYPKALSASDILTHYVTGHPVAELQETPKNSDRFVDSIGVVTHLSNTQTPYWSQWPAFRQLIGTLGVRHVRDALVDDPTYVQRMKTLAGMGIHADLTTDLTRTSSQLQSLLADFSGATESVEAPNEPDDQGNPDWVSQTRAFQKTLYSTVKRDPSTSSLPVIGPALVSEQDWEAFGDQSAYMDRGNSHDYFDTYNPGTAGWGSIHPPYGTYGSIGFYLATSAIDSGAEPIDVTESGYCDGGTGQDCIDGRTIAKYEPRVLLDHWLSGVERTFLYEFYDDGPAGDVFADFGLVSAQNVPKPSYYALRSLISLLADPGPSFAESPVEYFLSGDVSNLQHLLLQKRDGTYELVLWLETSGYDAGTDVKVPAQAVTVRVPSKATATGLMGTINEIGDSGSIETTMLRSIDGTATIMIDDHVTVVSIN